MNDFVVAGLGVSTVFVALVCIIFICNVMGWIFQKLAGKPSAGSNNPAVGAPSNVSSANAQSNASVVPAAKASYVKAELKNRGEFIAAVSAVIAQDLGTDVSHIRICSVRQRADSIPNRAELCAALSAVIAMDSGAEAVRIHSIRRV